MGYNDDLLFQGQPTKVEPGDILLIRLEDGAVAFRRNDRLLDIHFACGATGKWCPHYGEPREIPGIRHVFVAGDVAREVDLRLQLVTYSTKEAIYIFSL